MRARTSSGAVAIAALALGLVAGCGGSNHSAGSPADQGSASAAAASTPATGPAATGSTEPVPTPIRPPSVAPNTGTGIVGVTVVTGGCPVERVDQPCGERPVSAALSIVNPATNAVVTTVTSSADGIFRVAVAPGRYLIRSATPTGPLMSHALPVPVEVRAGQYTSVRVPFESGIR